MCFVLGWANGIAFNLGSYYTILEMTRNGFWFNHPRNPLLGKGSVNKSNIIVERRELR
jgi:hypothetical protein